MKRLGLVLAVVVLAALGAFAAIAFFNARDDAGVGTSASDAGAPGVPLSALGDVGTTRIDTPAGNVVILYSDARSARSCRRSRTTSRARRARTWRRPARPSSSAATGPRAASSPSPATTGSG